VSFSSIGASPKFCPFYLDRFKGQFIGALPRRDGAGAIPSISRIRSATPPVELTKSLLENRKDSIIRLQKHRAGE